LLWGSKYLEYIPESELNILQGEHEKNNGNKLNKALNGRTDNKLNNNRTINNWQQAIINKHK
jgi:hypothetical protein